MLSSQRNSWWKAKTLGSVHAGLESRRTAPASGRTEWIKLPEHSPGDTRWRAFSGAAGHDLVHAGGFLVVGAMAAATLDVLIPGRWLQAVADSPVLSVLALSLLAVLLSICSEADAFVAASLTQFSLTARLAFLVVGPMVRVPAKSSIRWSSG